MIPSPTMQDVNQALVAARFLITDPDAWTKGRSYRDGKGKGSTMEDACQFCSAGALTAALHGADILGRNAVETQSYKALCVAANMLGDFDHLGHSAVLFNDSTTTKHEDVLEMFDLAITMTEPS